MNILHIEPKQIPSSAKEKLETLGSVDYMWCENQEDLRKALRLKSYHAVFVRLGLAFHAKEFALCPDLRAVITPTTGLDHIDLKLAHKRGVEVLSLRGELEVLEKISSTAELTWTLLLSLVRKLPFAFNSVIDGHWNKWPFEGEELIEKTLGIVGCGRLGRMVARYGLAFGMRVVAYDPDEIARENAPQGVSFLEFSQLLETSDIVSLHVPLNEKTEGFFGRDCFAKMKEGAYFINTARGELTDEQALLEALTRNIKGAAVDVVRGDSRWDDGVPENHPLVQYAKKHQNLIITPHIGGCSSTATFRSREHVVDMFTSFVQRPARG
ncbi:MAG: NAD(P)-dependent oxidoreductase [Myxococcota bacterium]|nr:NAD(P)-dependent oxidoreductase [Myxococcota bacterium]